MCVHLFVYNWCFKWFYAVEEGPLFIYLLSQKKFFDLPLIFLIYFLSIIFSQIDILFFLSVWLRYNWHKIGILNDGLKMKQTFLNNCKIFTNLWFKSPFALREAYFLHKFSMKVTISKYHNTFFWHPSGLFWDTHTWGPHTIPWMWNVCHVPQSVNNKVISGNNEEAVS